MGFQVRQNEPLLAGMSRLLRPESALHLSLQKLLSPVSGLDEYENYGIDVERKEH